MSREFLPGNCTTPDNRELFLEADRGNTAAVALAKAACETCVQLRHCADQKEQIAIEIAKQGMDADSVVIGTIETPLDDSSLAKLSPLERLREPALEFDIKNLPQTLSPRQTLDAIRQALRARQIRVEGRPPNHKDMLEAHLREEPLLDDIETNTLDAVIEAGATIILRHRAFSLSQHHKAKLLTDAELERSRAIFREFTLDSISLSALGAKPRFAQYHDPDLYPRLIDEATKSNILTPAIARDLVRQYAIDPVGVLDQRYRASKSVKKSGEHKAAPPETKRYERELSQRHGDAQNAVKTLRSNFEQLAEQFPDIDRRACAAIAFYHPEDPFAAAARYADIYPECLTMATGSPFLTPYVISEIVLKNPTRGIEAMREIDDKAYTYYIATEDERIRSDPVFLGYTAWTVKRELTPEELTKRYTARRVTHKSSAKHPLLTKPAAVRIAEAIPEKEQRERAMLHASNLIRRELLVVTNDTLQWAPGADYLTPTEKQAVLAVLGLDVVLDNCTYDQQVLCDALSVDNLDDIVNRVLVPQILPVEKPRENLLEHARYRKANRLDSTTWVRQQQVAERLRHDHDFSEDQYLSQASYVHSAFKSFVVQIVDAFPDKLPRISAIQSATDDFFIDFKKLHNMAMHLGAEDQEALKRYVGEIPDFSDLIFTYAARCDHSIPLRFIRTLPEKQQILAEYHDRLSLTKTSKLRLVTATPDKMRWRLDEIVRLTEQYEADPWITKAQVHAICSDARDPASKVAAFIKASREIAFAYPDFFDRDDVGSFVIRRRNPVEKAAAVVQEAAKLEERYTGPEFNHYVFRIAATQKEPDQWLEQYKKRYHTANDIASPRTDKDTLKRLAALNHIPGTLVGAIRIYNALLDEFQCDDNVEPWMISNALRYTAAGCRARIYRMRFLRASGITLRRFSTDRDELAEANSNTMSLDAVLQQPSSEDAYIESQDQHEKQAEILTLLSKLTPIEQAAVLIAYNIDMPLPAGLSDEQVLQRYEVESPDELVSIVNFAIIPKIKDT